MKRFVFPPASPRMLFLKCSLAAVHIFAVSHVKETFVLDRNFYLLTK